VKEILNQYKAPRGSEEQERVKKSRPRGRREGGQLINFPGGSSPLQGILILQYPIVTYSNIRQNTPMNANKAFAARGTNEVQTFIPTYSEESILRLRKVRLNRRVKKSCPLIKNT
jgi:hypothetical protein